MSDDNIFFGLKVVDMASFIAGPGAATILSDFGANVVNVMTVFTLRFPSLVSRITFRRYH